MLSGRLRPNPLRAEMTNVKCKIWIYIGHSRKKTSCAEHTIVSKAYCANKNVFSDCLSSETSGYSIVGYSIESTYSSGSLAKTIFLAAAVVCELNK